MKQKDSVKTYVQRWNMTDKGVVIALRCEASIIIRQGNTHQQL